MDHLRPLFRKLGLCVIAALAIGATVTSLQFTRPLGCRQVCQEPAEAPCPDGACRFKEPRAGFPFPMVRDANPDLPTGSGTIGTLGEEDYGYSFNLLAFGGNVLFYGAILWLLAQAPRVLLTPTTRHERRRLLAAIGWVGLGVLSGVQSYRPAEWRPPPATAPPALALLGTWRGVEPTGAPIVLRFYGDQRAVWSASFDSTEGGFSGNYHWVDDRTVQIHIAAQLGGTIDMCSLLPALLVSACRTQEAAPTTTSLPPQRLPAGVTPSPTPTEAPYDVTVSRIELRVPLTVRVQGATLELQSQAGDAQTFQRVTGD